MQWSIKMKFAPLGSPLKSAQMHFKTASFGEGTKKLWGCKKYPYIYNGQVVWPQLLWIYLTANLWSTYMAASQHNVQTCAYFH